jgi:hypothetical protein
MARMDAINHAIPTAEELSVALGALIGAGLVESHGERFNQTPAGAAITRHWTGGMFEWADGILPHLNTMRRPGQVWPVTEEQMDRAYRRYVDR